METPIKPGKYKMRNGCQAIIAAVAPSELDVTQPVIGWWTASSIEERWTLGMWCHEGRFHIGPTQSEADLISPWIDAPIFDHWDKVPWAKCVYLVRENPTIWRACSAIVKVDQSPEGGLGTWKWTIADGSDVQYFTAIEIPKEHHPTWEGLNKDSLILRPANA